MQSPFYPHMDPYLELPALWPDVHNRLITAIADSLAPRLAPRYFVGLERRTYLLNPSDLAFVGRPDLSIIRQDNHYPKPPTLPLAEADVLIMEAPMYEEVEDYFLKVHSVGSGEVVTVMELLSPANKLSGKHRDDYLEKRQEIFRSRTNLVEIDLLRAGAPMPFNSVRPLGQYRHMVSRVAMRPKLQVYRFYLRSAIPQFMLPLLPGDIEPIVDIGAILHDVYGRARYDLQLDYSQPPVPPLDDEDAAWASEMIERWKPE